MMPDLVFVQAPDGKLIISGFFQRVNGLPRNSIARLHGSATRFSFSQPTLDRSEFSIRFPSVQGKHDSLEFKSNWATDEWVKIGSRDGTGAVMTLGDSSEPSHYRFYHVRVD